MPWSFTSNKECFTGSGGEILTQTGVFTVGQAYIIKFFVTDRTQGILRFISVTGEHVIDANGVFTIFGIALTTSFFLQADQDEDNLMFDGCVDNIEAYLVGDPQSIQLDYVSQCLNIQSDQGCLLHIEAINNNDSLNFNWDDLILSMRLNGKLAKVDYNGTQKEMVLDSSGNLNPIYFNGNRTRSLLIEAAPVWVHDFLYMCMAVDGFKINGDFYIIQESDYPEIEWNKKFTEGTVELQVRKRVYKLNRSNC